MSWLGLPVTPDFPPQCERLIHVVLLHMQFLNELITVIFVVTLQLVIFCLINTGMVVKFFLAVTLSVLV